MARGRPRVAAFPVDPSRLSWPQVDPGRHDFDPGGVADVVRRLPAAAAVPERPPGKPHETAVLRWGHTRGAAWVRAMSADLVDHYGPWASGWCWSVGEGDLDGGPVRAWCCAHHSITTPEATLRAVGDALVDWRRWLAELSAQFTRLLPTVGNAIEEATRDAWQHAFAHLITVVVERTAAESMWYGHCRQVLAWFLTAAGVPEPHHSLIDDAVGERFESWVPPSDDVIADVAGRLVRGLAHAHNA